MAAPESRAPAEQAEREETNRRQQARYQTWLRLKRALMLLIVVYDWPTGWRRF
jgi:hypothetical protein